jgi:hypothetical protein
MKGKLIKEVYFYGLKIDDKIVGLCDLDTNKILNYPYKLSIQNCDEIFGIIDVEKLAKEETRKYLPGCPENIMNFIAHERFFKIAFEKAIELNKDKLFTVEDMENCWDEAHQAGRYEEKGIAEKGWKNIKDFLKFLQQPTETDVEVEMDKIPADLAPGGWDVFPKLDSQGCLILKKVL